MNINLASRIQQQTINKVFAQRENFILLGVTGSVDSNLSEIRDILQSNFTDLALPDEIQGTIKEKLEYKNICHYAQRHWKKFDVIKTRDVIITYILENHRTLQRFEEEISKKIFDDTEFCNQCYSMFEKRKSVLIQGSTEEKEVYQELKEFQDNCFKNGLRKELLNKNQELLKYVEVLRSKSGSEQNARISLSLYVYTKYILPIIGQNIKGQFSSKKYYVSLFRNYGNEIRFFGTLDLTQWRQQLQQNDDEHDFIFFYSIAKRINTFIKIRRSPFSNKQSVPVHIVIDSLKNPYEFSFLKDRYSAYYTLALLQDKKNTENSDILYENPGKIKKNFKTFIHLTIEQLEQEHALVNTEDYRYIQALRLPDQFIQYILERLNKKEEGSCNIEWCSEMEGIKYGIQYQRLGIMEEEFLFFREILREPVRTFCMITDLFPFYLQDIQSSTQNADIFLSNSDDTMYGKKLTYQLVKYVSLIMHPGLVPPTNIEACMQVAFSAKVNSGCISRQVGAVVTDKDYNILSLGWNDVHCDKIPCIYRTLRELQHGCNREIYSDLELDKNSLFRKQVDCYNFTDYQKQENILGGLSSVYCFKAIYNEVTHDRNPSNSRAIHGEQRAFYACDKEKAKGGCLFTTSSSCEACTMFANQHEIKKIYYIESYPGIAQNHVNASGKIEKRAEFILFEGAIGVAYMKLYTPNIPMKDELQLRGIEQLIENPYLERSEENGNR